jgi:hypothetical protein
VLRRGVVDVLRGSWWPAWRHDDKYDAVMTFEEWEAVLSGVVASNGGNLNTEAPWGCTKD